MLGSDWSTHAANKKTALNSHTLCMEHYPPTWEISVEDMLTSKATSYSSYIIALATKAEQ